MTIMFNDSWYVIIFYLVGVIGVQRLVPTEIIVIAEYDD